MELFIIHLFSNAEHRTRDPELKNSTTGLHRQSSTSNSKGGEPFPGTELAGAEAAPPQPTEWEEVSQPRVQPLSLPDTPLGHPRRLPQNHQNPRASPGPRASCPPSAARERQRTSARCKPATAVLRLGRLGSSVAGNLPSGGASPPTPPSRCSGLGAKRGGSGRKGRRAAGAAQARVRLLLHLAGHAHIAFSLGTDDTGPSRPRPRLQSPLPWKSDLRKS